MTQEQLLGIVRHILTAAGGIIIARGLVSEALWEQIAGAALTVAGLVWSILSKKKS